MPTRADKPCIYAALLATVITAACSPNPSRPNGAELFLVAELPGREVYKDSYVISLTDPDLIAQARAIVVGHNRIVGARIAAGKDGVNRNYNAFGHPEWSWHVTEMVGFSEAAIELCDGTPTFVERDVAWWIANTGGRVCFWNYTVVAELNH